jgi:E3 ubiquitin-protein ligase UBR3
MNFFLLVDSPIHSLPTNEEELLLLRMDATMTSHNEKRLEELKRQFDDDSWLMAISAGWEGGVHVQTCGHHLHHECLREYHTSLKSAQRQHNISVER